MLSLEKVVEVYAMESPSAQQAALIYQNAVLTYRNYQKSFLPSVSFSANPFSFNRSIQSLQNPEDGSYNYVNDYASNSNAGVSVSQLVGVTGGSFQANSSLNMLSEYKNNRNSFSASIFNIGYSQQLFGGYKKYRFTKKIEETQYHVALKKYAQKLSGIQEQALALWLDLYIIDVKKEIAEQDIANSDTLLSIGRSRYENGVINEQSYLQIELQSTNSQLEKERLEGERKAAWRKIATYLDLSETGNYQIEAPEVLPPDHISYEKLYALAVSNNPFHGEQQVQKWSAEQSLYVARLGNRFNANINLSYGLNQYSRQLVEAYKRPVQQQSVSIGFQIPIFDWGINTNQYHIAKNSYKSTMIDLEQSRNDFDNQLKTEVDNYNIQSRMLQLSRRSFELARKQYRLLRSVEYLGQLSVLELTTAHNEQYSALQSYCEQFRSVWLSYFRLRSLALFDFVKNEALIDQFFLNEE